MKTIDLIHALLDDNITADQLAELELQLRNDWQARRLYLEMADIQARLHSQPALGTGKLTTLKKAVKRPLWRRSWLPLSAAAALALAGWAIWPKNSTPVTEETLSSGVAMLGQTLDAQFSSAAMRSGDTLKPGRVRLRQGLAKIEFFSGATALIEGEAELEILSAWEARCHSGRVRLHVPPAAKGFLLHTPDVRYEDLGTSLKQGMTHGAPGAAFLPIADLTGLLKQRQDQRHAAWKQWTETARHDTRLIAYYNFKHWEDDRWDRVVNNITHPTQKGRAGGAVGASWTAGRWPGKDALEFKRPGDRVRMKLDGTYQALSMTCWVKVDSVDKKYNSLLLTDGYENGEPHWQIHEDGSLMFSLMYKPDESSTRRGGNQIYFSKPVFDADSLGRWHHLAVTYDAKTGETVQYFDSREVGREISPLHVPDRPISFGPCEIGNWGLPTTGHQFPVRNLNGSIDEFTIYQAVLSGQELDSIYQNGKPE
jgi:hypothetical protein